MVLAGDVWGDSSSKAGGAKKDDEWEIKFDDSMPYHVRGKRKSTRSATFVHSGQSYNPSPDALRSASEMAAVEVRKHARDIKREEQRMRLTKRARQAPYHMFAEMDSDDSDSDEDAAAKAAQSAEASAPPPSKRAMKKDQERKMRQAASLALPQAERNRLKRREQAERQAAEATTSVTDADIEAAAKASEAEIAKRERLRVVRAKHKKTAGVKVCDLGPSRVGHGLEVALPEEVPSCLRTLQKAQSVLHPALAREESLKDRGIVLGNRRRVKGKRPAKQRKSYNVYARTLDEQKERETELVREAHPDNRAVLKEILA